MGATPCAVPMLRPYNARIAKICAAHIGRTFAQEARMTTTKSNKAVPGGKLPATYEAALSELESLVQKMESGQVPLDELLAGYQRGAALLALCKEKLSAVEEQIKLLETSPQGALVTKPWDEGEA